MNRTGRKRLVVLVVGTIAHLGVWLLLRPDAAGGQWTDGRALETWLALVALLALVVGVLAPDRQTAVVTVVAGWFAQMAHFAVLGEHYDDALWAVGLVVQAVVAAAAVGLAVLARWATGRATTTIGA